MPALQLLNTTRNDHTNVRTYIRLHTNIHTYPWAVSPAQRSRLEHVSSNVLTDRWSTYKRESHHPSSTLHTTPPHTQHPYPPYASHTPHPTTPPRTPLRVSSGDLGTHYLKGRTGESGLHVILTRHEAIDSTLFLLVLLTL